MKKSLLVLAVLLMAVSFSVAAAQVTGTTEDLILQGAVDKSVYIAVNDDETNAQSLNLTTGEAGTKVATLTYYGNVAYDVTINDDTFELVGNATPTVVGYTLNFDGTPLTSTAVTSGDASQGVNTKDLTVDIDGNQFLPPDTYQDTITFTITSTN